ncbi:urease accessory protein UreE [Devosia sp. ZB163]|uniref:urease accessory protein UreE n=1 Tax=Devosia sp. ZB163 TaxID=3025938 RepID=UPI0023613D4E|nr:urease accessory protein UreE [Devosia sp. ZB163]MDC9825869.1 urease accessory protein UreE [Devosia sp. ZB163]
MPQTFRAVSYVPPGKGGIPFDLAVLLHDERRVRRRSLTLVHGDSVLVDFPEPVTLADRSMLELEDGRLVEIIAGEEQLYEVRGRDQIHLKRLCWHLGNRHLKTQIEDDRVLILRDHVIRDMLRGLGATVTDVTEPFNPEEGAYSHNHGEPAHALLNR